MHGKDILKLRDTKGYTMYRDDREGKEGGWTILYVRNKLEHRSCRPLNTQDFESSAWCWIIEKGEENPCWKCIEVHPIQQ